MDTTLVTVTLLSMAMAASLSVIVWRMLRVERERSEARVIALTAIGSSAVARARRLGRRASRIAHRPHRDFDLDIREAPESAKRPGDPDVRGA